MSDRATVTLHPDQTTAQNVVQRANRLISTGPPESLGDVGSSVQFLRGVGSRAMFALPSFYLLLGSDIDSRNRCTVQGYPGGVLQAQICFASQTTIALACRKAFDHGGKGLTGATFGRTSDAALRTHAEFWSKTPGKSREDTYRALCFLRAFFNRCSKNPNALLNGSTTLERRIGLLKQYADRSAAHLSPLEPYEFDTLDIAHVVAALAVVASVIHSFDSGAPRTYVNDVDSAAFEAAQALFPDMPKLRLFEHVDANASGRFCWLNDHAQGLQWLMEQLPYATGWY